MPPGKPKGDVSILREFFGKLPNQTLADFKKQDCDPLSAEEKRELADLARVEMGLPQLGPLETVN